MNKHVEQVRNSHMTPGPAPVLQDQQGPAPHALLILTICVWLGSFALSTIRDLAVSAPDLSSTTPSRLVFAFVGAVLCYPLHLALKTLRGQVVAVQLCVAVLLSAGAAIFYTSAIFNLTAISNSAAATSDPTWRFYNTVYWAVIFLSWSAMYLALTYGWRLAEEAKRASRAEALAHEAELRALRYQVEPHFLFNALNSVSALVMMDRNKEAEEMLERLSLFYRASLASDPRRDLALADEVEIQRRFLEIEQVRFPDLKVSVDVSSSAAVAQIPALLLQPIVENAVKFGVSGQDGAACIAIEAHASTDRVHIAITNDQLKASSRLGTGTGLRNVRERLHARFGENYRFEAGPVEPFGFKVSLEIPLVKTGERPRIGPTEHGD